MNRRPSARRELDGESLVSSLPGRRASRAGLRDAEAAAPASAEVSETRRALVGAALGVAMGLLVALFARRDERGGAAEGGRGWRGKSAT